MTVQYINGVLVKMSPSEVEAFELERAALVRPVQYKRLDPVSFSLGLLRLNIVPADVTAYIEALPEPDKTVADIYWSRAQNFDRDNPLVDQIAIALGKTVEEVNDAWLQVQPD